MNIQKSLLTLTVCLLLGLVSGTAMAHLNNFRSLTISDALDRTDGAQALVAAIQEASQAGCLGRLDNRLSNPQSKLVMFAPTNSAWAKFFRQKKGTFDGRDTRDIKDRFQSFLDNVELDTDALCEILRKHVAIVPPNSDADSGLSALVREGDITMADGSDFPVSVGPPVEINYESEVGEGDFVAKNGIIHFVNSVIQDQPPPSGNAVTVFTTADVFQGNLGGLAGADTLCTNAATVAGLSGTWKAWLSDTSEDAINRIPDGEYWTVGNTDAPSVLVATDKSDLTDGSLNNGINQNEFGNPPQSSFVWTGTLQNGTVAGSHCSDWTVNSSPAGCGTTDLECANNGITTSVDGLWTDKGDGPQMGPCGGYRALYCFGGD